MSDFTSLKLQANVGASDASPTWSDVLFGTAGYELRANKSGGGATGSTSAANWPSVLKPTTGTQLLDQLFAFSADTTGSQVVYDGTGSHYNEFRVSWDNLGTFGSAPTLSAYKDNTLPAASPGSQPGTGDGSSVVNGSSDTSNTSYLKAAAYGVGRTAGGTADNPSANMGSNPTATSGSAGAVTTTQGAWSSWQSLQAATQWIANGATPAATTAGAWNFLLAYYIGANMTGGTLLPVLAFTYTWI